MNPLLTDNLLFGILALQNHVIDQADLIAAFHDWSNQQDRPLATIMLDRGVITNEDVLFVDMIVARHLKHQAGNARASLAAVADLTARRVIGSVGHHSFRASLNELPPELSQLRIDTLIGAESEQRDRYSLSYVHGEGGLGRLWVARDLDLNRRVALKEIRPTKSTDKSSWSRFLKEAQITGQLEHPGIVPVYELARRTEDNQPYYTMRFVDGGTFGAAIQQHHKRQAEVEVEPGNFRDLLHALISVCQAIGYAHSRGVIHRDLKPENIVKGDFGVVMVLDWGLAKLVNRPDDPYDPMDEVEVSHDAAINKTAANSPVGTPQYMSPEQAAGQLERIDARTDIYGLGAILFEILTGAPPHKGRSSEEIIIRILSEETPKASALGKPVPSKLEAIAFKAMSKNCEDRYQSTNELAADIQRFLDDEPVSAYPEGMSARVARWVRRRQRLLINVIFLLLVGIFAFGVSNLRLQSEKAETFRQAEMTRKYFLQGRINSQELLNYAVRGGDRSTWTLRKSLLKTGLKQYEQFLSEAVRVPELQREMAPTLALIAYSYFHIELEDALNSTDANQFARVAPESTGIPLPAPASLGLVLRSKPDFTKAIKSNNEAIRHYERLIRVDPADSNSRDRLEVCLRLQKFMNTQNLTYDQAHNELVRYSIGPNLGGSVGPDFGLNPQIIGD